MPKEITHIQLAEAIKGELLQSNGYGSPEIKNALAKHGNVFSFGSISPDIFFYDIVLPFDGRHALRGGPWGDAIHGNRGENTMAHIFAMAEILNSPQLQKSMGYKDKMPKDDADLCLTFGAGYLTHVALDTVMHPLVYYFSGNYYADDPSAKKWGEARHRAIETLLDLLVLQKLNKKLSKVNAAKLMTLSRREEKVVLGFYALALRLAFGNEEEPLMPSEPLFSPPKDIYHDRLYRAARRGYHKQRFMNRLFRIKALGKAALKLNWYKKQAIAEFSTLMYPAATYSSYLKRYKPALDLLSLKSYRHPVSNQQHSIDYDVLARRGVARGMRYIAAFDKLVQSPSKKKALSYILNGASLNNGAPGVPANSMKFFAPVPIDGNFQLMS